MSGRRIEFPVITIGIWTYFYKYIVPRSRFRSVKHFRAHFFFFFWLRRQRLCPGCTSRGQFRRLVFRTPFIPVPDRIMFVRAPRRRKIIRQNADWNVQIPPTETPVKQINSIFSKISIINPCRWLTSPPISTRRIARKKHAQTGEENNMFSATTTRGFYFFPVYLPTFLTLCVQSFVFLLLKRVPRKRRHYTYLPFACNDLQTWYSPAAMNIRTRLIQIIIDTIFLKGNVNKKRMHVK